MRKLFVLFLILFILNGCITVVIEPYLSDDKKKEDPGVERMITP